MVKPQPIRESLEKSARWYPEKTAIKILDNEINIQYEELDDLTNKFANNLHEYGVRQGDRVAIILPQPYEYIISLYGSFKGGYVPVPINYKTSIKRTTSMVNNVNAQVLIIDDTQFESVEEIINEQSRDLLSIVPNSSPSKEFMKFNKVISDGDSSRPPKFHRGATEASFILHTSGTTGQPDSIIHSMTSGWGKVLNFIYSAGMNADSKFLNLLPSYAGASFAAIRASVKLGSSIFVMEELDVEMALNCIENERISHVFSVPTITERILQVDNISKRDLDSIKHWRHTGAVLTKEKANKFRQNITSEIYNVYGATELGTISMLRPEDLPEHGGTTGRPILDNDIRIVDNNCGENVDVDSTVSKGKQGRIIVRSPGLFEGYFDNNTKYATKVENGWFITNDIGRVTENNYLEVTGRADDHIISGAELISAVNVEEVLMEHNKVEDAIVIGGQDDKWGERVKAIVVVNQPVSKEELDQFCKENSSLANYKRPREYEFVDQIKKTETGKKQRSHYRS